MGSRSGLNIVDEDGLSVFGEGLSRITDIFVDEAGQVWVVHGSGLSVFDGRSWQSLPRPEGVYTVDDVVVDSAGRVWIGYYEGVSVLDGGEWSSYSSEEFGLGEFASLVHDIAIDHQGQAWVATASGVAVFDGDSWTPYDETSGLTYDATEAVVVDHQGKVWVAHSYGVDVFDGSSWIFYGEKYDREVAIEVKALSSVTALAVDNQGYVWAGTYGSGVSVFDGSDWTTYESRECLYGSPVNSIAGDSQGRLWLGTDLGLAVFDGESWFHYTKNTTGLLSNDIGAVIVTGAGPSSLPPAPSLEPGSARGKVTRDGEPLEGATVVVCWSAHLLYSGESPCSGDSYSAVTDENGEFYIPGIPPYKYSLAIQVPEGTWKVLMGYTYIVDGETTNIGTLSL